MEKITGIILSGGKSTRMGRDKGLLDFGDEKMVVHQAKLLKPFCDEILISANSKEYEKFGHTVIFDEFADIGPIGGLFSALKASKSNLNVVLSCDIPFVNEIVIKELLRNVNDSLTAASIAVFEDRIHPLIGVYNKRLMLGKIFMKIQEGNYKLMNLLDRSKITFVNFSVIYGVNESTFANINTKADYEKLVTKKPEK